MARNCDLSYTHKRNFFSNVVPAKTTFGYIICAINIEKKKKKQEKKNICYFTIHLQNFATDYLGVKAITNQRKKNIILFLEHLT